MKRLSALAALPAALVHTARGGGGATGGDGAGTGTAEPVAQR